MELDVFAFLKVLAQGVVKGELPVVLAALVVVFVAALRKFGPMLQAALPDHTIADKVLAFVFVSRPGGYILNVLTSVAAGLGVPLLAGISPSWGVWKPVLAASVSAMGLVELVRDLWAWWQARKAPAADRVLTPVA